MKRIFHYIFLLISILPVWGQETTIHKEIDTAAAEGADPEEAIPSFINLGANHIEMNGADWTLLRQSLSRVGEKPFSIVHIGDSHLQPDVLSGKLRELLQYDYGNAGRGLVAPFKLNGTYQPRDYAFESPDRWDYVKLLSSKWPRTMGFNGTSISPKNRTGRFSISTTGDDYDPFASVTLFHKGRLDITGVTGEDGTPIDFTTIPSMDYTHLWLASPQTKITVSFTSSGDLTLFCANLSGDRPGLFYHTIGNGGSTYLTYNRIGTTGEGMAPLHPDLVIISLGTNESLGTVNPQFIYRTIDRLVSSISRANPDAALLLVTPIECQHRPSVTVSKRVKQKTKNGKTRYVTKKVKQRAKEYSINENTQSVRDIIAEYGRDRHIPVLDMYEIAGGQGSSNLWIEDGLFNSDRIHNSAAGYRLQAQLIYQALKEAFEE